MANSTGDPETGKMEDVTEGLEELCESSKEQSEEALLVSLLEQHHHPVSVLRKKGDERCHRAQEQEKELLEAQGQQAGTYAWEVDSLKKQLQLLQERHQHAAARAGQAESQQRAQDSELQAKLERAREEKEQLLTLAMQRSKALRDKEWEIQKLEEKLETVEEAMQREERCLKKEAALDKDLKVQELQGQLEHSKQAYNELLLQFNAYRKHGMDLLTKERALNVKLRHFVA